MLKRAFLVSAVVSAVVLPLLVPTIGTSIGKPAASQGNTSTWSPNSSLRPKLLGQGVRLSSATSLNASISSPIPPPSPTSPTTFKNGVSVSITGTAAGSGFQNFQVDWAPGLDASSGWQTGGVTVAGGGAAAVTNGLLASWDTSSITSAGYYTIRLTVNIAGSPLQALTMIYLEPDLLSSNWPQYVNPGPAVGASAIPARNADGSYRLVMEGPAGPGSAFGSFWTLPLNNAAQSTLQTGHGGFFNPAVANFTAGAGDEAMVLDFDPSPASSLLELFAENGTFSSLSTTSNLWNLGSQLVTEDLAGTSTWQTLGYGIDYTNSVAYVSAWQSDGTEYNGNFPIQVSFLNPNDGRLDRNTVLAGDVNGDGKKEIVVMEILSPTTFTLGLFGNDGTPITWNAPTLSGTPVVMAAADLDNNGKLETIVAANSDTQSFVHVLQPDGSERPGWPLTLYNSNVASQSYLAVGDLNVNGQKDIVYSNESYLYVWNPDGSNFSSAWPLQASSAGESFGFNAVTIGDVDGDGFPEIVTVLNTLATNSDPYFQLGEYANQQLVAIRRDGTTSKSWQLNAGNGCWLQFWPAPAIGDFNQDGITDIAVTFQTGAGNCSSSTPGDVTVLSTGAAYHPGVNDWPLTRHDPRNTSVFRCSDFCLDASAPQTVNAGESASYTLTITPNEFPYPTAINGLTCAGLPTGASCAFSSTSVTPGGAPASTALTISTTARESAMGRPAGGNSAPTVRFISNWGELGVAIIFLALAGSRKRVGIAQTALVLIAILAIVSCGVGSGGSHTNPNGTPAGSYTIAVSASGDSHKTQTTNVSLNVN